MSEFQPGGKPHRGDVNKFPGGR